VSRGFSITSLPPVIIVGLALALPLFISDPVTLHVLFMVFLYAILGEAYNIIAGFAGQFSLCQQAFFGIGAYTSAVMFSYWRISPWIGMLLGASFSVCVSLVIGYPVLRLRGHYFVLATLALGQMIKIIFLNWKDVGGAFGIWMPVVPDSLLYFQFHTTKAPYYYIVLLLLLLTVLVTYKIRNSRLGLALFAIKEDEVAAKTTGINAHMYKLTAFAISAIFTSIGGSIFAQYVLIVEPESVMSFWVVDLMLIVAVLGGLKSVIGPLIGSFLLIPVSEYTRFLLGAALQGVHTLVYGSILILFAIALPHGVAGWVVKAYDRLLVALGSLMASSSPELKTG